MEIHSVKLLRRIVAFTLFGLCAATAGAALFEDDEARKAILELRQRVDTARLESEQGASRASEDRGLLRRSMLDLQSQI